MHQVARAVTATIVMALASRTKSVRSEFDTDASREHVVLRRRSLDRRDVGESETPGRHMTRVNHDPHRCPPAWWCRARIRRPTVQRATRRACTDLAHGTCWLSSQTR